MKALIKTVELSKHYKKAIALNNVSVTIPEGAIYGLVGNNGAGKTTLMRLLANLQQPTGGHIDMDTGLKIGALIEYPALYPLMSARGNLIYQLRLKGYTRKEAKTTAADLLALVCLENNRKRVMHYSLGMKQRLALALALVGEPDFLILDEPMNGLDKAGVESMRELFLKLRDQGKTILLASHNEDDIHILCDEIHRLDGGSIME